MLATIFLPFLLLFQTPTLPTLRPTETPQVRPSPIPDPRDEPPIVTHHATHIGPRALNYSVTTGFMPLKNAVSGDTEARIFYMAYTLDNPPARRPLMFSFNGGPGSASVWLHLGALGP